jgi:hypothetical protein
MLAARIISQPLQSDDPPASPDVRCLIVPDSYHGASPLKLMKVQTLVPKILLVIFNHLKCFIRL